jgi:hypothetical protein
MPVLHLDTFQFDDLKQLLYYAHVLIPLRVRIYRLEVIHAVLNRER